VSPAGPSSSGGPLAFVRPRWESPPFLEPAVVRRLEAALRLPDTVCAVLAAREVTDPEQAKDFLRPRLDHLHDPEHLADGDAAADRIHGAISRGETILVHGDYDVDGICAAALLTRYLRSLGGVVVPFVPHRLEDGYDFGEGGLRRAESVGASLILTADCGTAALTAVDQAQAAGRDVIVTDHHTPGPRPPRSLAFVNPRRLDCGYPNKDLCGTAVAFKLCELVRRRFGADAEDLRGFLDLVALATVADLVPLRGENRALVRIGLRYLARTKVTGLARLLHTLKVDPGSVTAGQLGFVVAPRINAAGRLGDAEDALRLLLSEDSVESRALAERLDDMNRERRDEDRRTLDQALELLASDFQPERDFGVVLASDGWHPGVIGIVASRVVERIHRPVVLVALNGDTGRGSARSVPGFHLYDALAACSAHLNRFGGHKQAAGLDLDRQRVPELRSCFNREARSRLEGAELGPVLRPDVELDLMKADLELVHWLHYLSPHGIGNARPLFLVRRVRVERPRALKDLHLKVTLRREGASLDAIGFGMVESHPPGSLTQEAYDVVLRLERNEWRGAASVQGRLVDLRPASEGSP
jgi:single-stranded-DNA-specific exonuclease